MTTGPGTYPLDDTMNVIMSFLRSSKYGCSIADLTKKTGLNRNTVSKYLNILLTLGQAEVQIVGPSKVFHLSERLPVSPSFMKALPTSAYITGVDGNILWANSYFLEEFNCTNGIIGKKYLEVGLKIFEVVASLPKYIEATAGKAGQMGSWTYITNDNIRYRLWVSPVVFFDGTLGVLVIIESFDENIYPI